jgi:hypothetical protein
MRFARFHHRAVFGVEPPVGTNESLKACMNGQRMIGSGDILRHPSTVSSLERQKTAWQIPSDPIAKP